MGVFDTVLTRFFFLQQAARRPEDDAASIAKTVAENHEDEGLREGFVDLVIQL